MSPMPNFSDDDITPESSPFKHKSTKTIFSILTDNTDNTVNDHNVNSTINDNTLSENSMDKNETYSSEHKLSDSEKSFTESTEIGTEVMESLKKQNSADSGSKKLTRDNSSENNHENMLHTNITQLAQIKNENCGFPLSIFKQGYLCLPYLSLPYLDLLIDVNVRGYIIGATNVLFKQKRQLYDILVDFDGTRIECQDPELRKQLHLTTEDLRFADYIVKHVSEEKHDVFLDGVGWEGGDEWIRTQFKVYLLCLLRTSLLQGKFTKT